MTSHDKRVRELAWTAAGASAGALTRYWVGQIGPDTGHTVMPTLILTATAAAVVGFMLVSTIRRPVKTALIAAGGAAGSISAAAIQAASATPAQSIITLAGFFASAVAGVPLGMLVAVSAVRHTRLAERR